MKWTKVSDSCIQCGDWRIFKYSSGFELWQWPVFKGRYETAAEAKERAGK
jgi:hypothetical protein